LNKRNELTFEDKILLNEQKYGKTGIQRSQKPMSLDDYHRRNNPIYAVEAIQPNYYDNCVPTRKQSHDDALSEELKRKKIASNNRMVDIANSLPGKLVQHANKMF
jgi:hypothetical protein